MQQPKKRLDPGNLLIVSGDFHGCFRATNFSDGCCGFYWFSHMSCLASKTYDIQTWFTYNRWYKSNKRMTEYANEVHHKINHKGYNNFYFGAINEYLEINDNI